MELHKDISAGKCVLIFSAYFLLCALYSWPLPIHFFDGITGTCAGKVRFMCLGDHLQSYYHMGLLTEALHGNIKWFTNPMEYASNDSPSGFFSYFLPASAIYAPFTVVSKTFAYNCFMLICFALGGFFACLFTHELTKNVTASFIAGFVVNFAFYRQVEIKDGLPGGFFMFMIPLTLFCLERTFTRRSVTASAVAGAAMFSLSINVFHYIYYLCMFFLAYFPWRLFSEVAGAAESGQKAATMKKTALAMIPFLVGAATGVAFLLHIEKTMMSQSSISGWSLAAIGGNSSPLMGMINDETGRRGVYLGVPILIAALWAIGIGVFSSRKNEPRKWDIIFFAAVFVVSYILAFGPAAGRPNPLYEFFYNYLPYFKMSRTPSKFMSITLLSLSALVAYLFAWILRGGKWAYLLKPAGFLLFMAIAYDFHPGGTGISLLDNNNAVYARAAKDIGKGGGRVINIPLFDGMNATESLYEYYAIEYGLPMINQYTPLAPRSFLGDVFFPLYPLNTGEIGPAEAERLRKMRVSRLFLHRGAFYRAGIACDFEKILSAYMNSPYISLIANDGNIWLFKLAAPDEKPSDKSAAIDPRQEFTVTGNNLVPLHATTAPDKSAVYGFALKCSSSYDSGGPHPGFAPANAGPHTGLHSGKYKLTFRLKTTDNSSGQPILFMDVTSRMGRITEVARELKGTDFKKAGKYQDFDLDLTLQKAQPWVEFHLTLVTPVTVYLDNIRVRPVNDQPGLKG